jgi:uncharacterized protein YqeY
VSDLTDRLRVALKDAMKQRDRDATTALRTTLAAIENAGAVDAGASGPLVASGPIAGATAGVGATEVARRDLTVDEELALVRLQVSEREDAATGYEAAGQAEAATRLRAEAAALRLLTGDTPST